MTAALSAFFILGFFAILELQRPEFAFSPKTIFQNHLRNLFLGLGSLLLVSGVFWFWPFQASEPLLENFWLELGLCFLILDLTSWIWHWMNHRVDLLWKSHRVHHTDLALNATSALRFHFLEMIPGNVLRLSVILLFGFSPQVLLIFQLTYFFFNVFQHSNLHLPQTFEDRLQWIFITPKLHHLHHSMRPEEHRANLGTVFSFWDRIFGTRLTIAHRPFQYGLGLQGPPLSVGRLLTFPFQR